ncbi:hypothetical protein LJC72_03595 [Bacteroides sp. OttesenSCG-928-D19]|nr:hypothetical protein [Bacteroides sp. OttesenSCG-928-D19]
MSKVFENKFTDKVEYQRIVTSLTAIGEELMASVSVLKEKDIPTSLGFLRSTGATDEAYLVYIRQLAETEISINGGVLMNDSDRVNIVTKWNTIIEGTIPHIRTIRRILSGGKVVPTEGVNGLSGYDLTAIKRVAKLASTYNIDGNLLAEYYNKVLQMREAIDSFRQFEQEHSLPDFTSKGAAYTSNGMFYTMSFNTFFDKGASPELFTQIMLKYVRVK